MFRRLIITTAVLTAALCSTSAYATVTRDPGYGHGGIAGVAVECALGTLQGMDTRVGYGGRVFLFQKCAHGFNRLIALSENGKVDTSYGYKGHVEIKFPAPCFGGLLVMRPTKSGALFIVSEGGYVGYEGTTELHACSVRVSATGHLDATYGGTTPIRHLDRVSQGANYLIGAAVDSLGRLVVFSTQEAAHWQQSAAFIDRYAANGKPDVTFSHDGERSYVQALSAGTSWGGVVGTKPMIAIQVAGARGNLAGFQFIRFDSHGAVDTTFARDGSRFVPNAAVDGARIMSDGMTTDTQGRVVFVAVHYGGAKTWIDVYRLTRAGSIDTAYNGSTAPIVLPSGYDAALTSLEVTPGHYVVSWTVDPPTGAATYRATGFSDTNGARWTALGVQGSAKVEEPRFAPDAAKFYLADDYVYASENASAVYVTRELVQE